MHLERHSRLVEYRRGLARYTPIARIAVGGMGEVWRGEATFPDGFVEKVAIKRILPWLAGTPLYRIMLEDEARLGLMLKHDNIVRVYDARMQGSFILVMEYVEGCSLNQLIQRIMKRGGYLPPAASIFVARELACALSYAHGAFDEWGRELAIIHGDVSPHNVLVGAKGEVKLMDFGLARATANLAERDPKKVSGKPGYVAPELVTRREATQQSDLFALGVVLWECVTGRRLFKGRNPVEDLRLVKRCEVPAASSVNPSLSPEIDVVLGRLLEKNPKDRYASAVELSADLDGMLLKLPSELGRSQLMNMVRKSIREGERRRPGSLDSAVLSEFPPQPNRADVDDVITNVYERPPDTATLPALC